MGKLAAAGWIVAILIAGVSYLGYEYLLEERQTAVNKVAAEYESRMAKVKADAEKQVQQAKAEALASTEAMKVELDYEKLPDLPLKFAFRKNQVLYVESLGNEEFTCLVKLNRPSTGANTEKAFTLPGRAFRDLAAIDKWVFESGDQVEFTKEGHKPWKGEIP